MAQANEGKKNKPAHRVLMYAQTAEDISIIQDILAGIGAEGVVCTDTWDLCWQMAQDTDALLLTEQSLADGALPILAEALEGQPDWSDLPVLFVAAGGAESPLAVQAMQELRNVVILDRPVHIATLASVLRMASRVRDKQRQVRDLLQERDRQEQRLRQLAELLEEDVKAKTETLTDTIDRLHDEVAGRTLAEGKFYKSSQMLVEAIEKSRSLSHELSPPGLSKSDLHEAFEWLAQQFQTKHGLTVFLDTCEGVKLPSELRAILYKAAQDPRAESGQYSAAGAS